jgi:hypothetical protein
MENQKSRGINFVTHFSFCHSFLRLRIYGRITTVHDDVYDY